MKIDVRKPRDLNIIESDVTIIVFADEDGLNATRIERTAEYYAIDSGYFHRNDYQNFMKAVATAKRIWKDHGL